MFDYDTLNRLSVVKRWAVIDVGRRQSVAEHSYNVAMMVMHFCEVLDLPDPYVFVRYAMVHDGHEAYTSDIPSNFKRALVEAGGEEALAKAEEACFDYHHIVKYAHTDLAWIVCKYFDNVEAWRFLNRCRKTKETQAVQEELIGKIRACEEALIKALSWVTPFHIKRALPEDVKQAMEQGNEA